MDIKDIIKRLNRARETLMRDSSLSEEDRQILMSLNLESDIQNNIIHIKRIAQNKHQTEQRLSDEQKSKLRLIEKTGTGSQKIH